MNLHRSSEQADWKNIAPASRSIWQKVAAATYGIITPANLISVVGFGLVIYGLIEIVSQNFWSGLGWLVIGRLLDVVDGAVAEATQTKSPLGEAVDAVIDKLGTILTIIALILADLTHWSVIAALVLPQLLIPLVIIYKKRRGIHVHPTRVGKLSMATVWAAIIGLIVLQASAQPPLLAAGVYLVVGLSLGLGLFALWQYATNRQ